MKKENKCFDTIKILGIVLVENNKKIVDNFKPIVRYKKNKDGKRKRK